MPRNRLYFIIALALAMLLAIWYLFLFHFSDRSTPPGHGLPTAVAGDSPDAYATTAGTDSSDAAPAVIPSPALVGSTPEEAKLLNQLQDYLDVESRHPEALRLALEFATTGSQSQQLAAVNAFRWLGGAEAKNSLVNLVRDASVEVADEAQQVLLHLLNQDLYAENPDPFDPDLWKRAINSVVGESEQEALLVLLSAYPPRNSIPVLVDLVENSDQDLSKLAGEYLDSNTGGAEIENREQAEQWLAEQEQEQTKQDEEAKAQETKDEAVDLPRFEELKRILAEEGIEL